MRSGEFTNPPAQDPNECTLSVADVAIDSRQNPQVLTVLIRRSICVYSAPCSAVLLMLSCLYHAVRHNKRAIIECSYNACLVPYARFGAPPTYYHNNMVIYQNIINMVWRECSACCTIGDVTDIHSPLW